MRKELSKLTPQIVFIVFSIAFFYCRGVNGATYFVDSSVTDTNVASATPDFTTYNHATFETTGGMDSVFKTIADINAFAALQPGDSVLFRRNQTWAEVLTIPASGTAGNPITFGAFGT